ncbi:MAG: bifunctional 5,10-methylenetetrahydrofolate dehydrogenase/5,10-methenyltetrahydrofolate cyclohydrolase, partial [Verrucomicrobiota bacterium]
MKKLIGKEVADTVYAEIRAAADDWRAGGDLPGLAVVLVGEDPASKAYVGAKDRKCAELGFHSQKIEMPGSVSQEKLMETIQVLNGDPSIHGILVQMPLPEHIDTDEVIQSIAPEKDVDGLHPMNLGKLVMEDPSGFAPCTPLGCQKMLLHYGIPTEGQRVVVVGRSLLVGKSFSLLSLAKGAGGNATVTVAHSRTQDLPSLCQEADILVAAIGRPKFVTADFVKEGAVVLDVGINRVEDPTAKRGYRLVGDVDYE